MAALQPPPDADFSMLGTPGPSLPGTPVHSINTMRRKASGHSGPLTKILVANRGVSCSSYLLLVLG